MAFKRGRSAGPAGKAAPMKRGRSAPPKPRVSSAQLAKVLGVEEKNIDLLYTSVSIGTDWQALVPSGAISSPWQTGIVQGDGDDQRDGRRIQVKRVQIKGTIDRGNGVLETQTGAPGIARVILVWDKQCNGLASPVETIMIATGNAKQDTVSLRNPDFKDRYVILMDKTFVFQPDGAYYSTASGLAYLGPASKVFSFSANVNIPTTYSGSTGVVGDITDNSIALFGVTAGFTMYITANARLTFMG